MKALSIFVCLLFLITGIPISAQDPIDKPAPTVSQVDLFGVPTKQIFIYLDNSRTIVKDVDDRPSVALGDMLEKALDSTAGLTTPEDIISIFNFGNDIKNDISVTGKLAKDGTWKDAITNFKRKAAGDKKTDLTSVFDEIAQAAGTKSDKIKIFIIASDFVHDPDNFLIKDPYKRQIKAETIAKIDDMKKKVGELFNASNPQCYLFLLQELPTVDYGDADNKKGFEEVADQTVRWLQNRLNASSLFYPIR